LALLESPKQNKTKQNRRCRTANTDGTTVQYANPDGCAGIQNWGFRVPQTARAERIHPSLDPSIPPSGRTQYSKAERSDCVRLSACVLGVLPQLGGAHTYPTGFEPNDFAGCRFCCFWLTGFGGPGRDNDSSIIHPHGEYGYHRGSVRISSDSSNPLSPPPVCPMPVASSRPFFFFLPRSA